MVTPLWDQPYSKQMEVSAVLNVFVDSVVSPKFL